jgi:hypothetical protein
LPNRITIGIAITNTTVTRTSIILLGVTTAIAFTDTASTLVDINREGGLIIRIGPAGCVNTRPALWITHGSKPKMVNLNTNSIASTQPHRPSDEEIDAAVADLAMKVQATFNQLHIPCAVARKVESLLIAELAADIGASRERLSLRL